MTNYNNYIPTEEEMDAMYEEYLANYGEIFDAQFCNGAR